MTEEEKEGQSGRHEVWESFPLRVKISAQKRNKEKLKFSFLFIHCCIIFAPFLLPSFIAIVGNAKKY